MESMKQITVNSPGVGDMVHFTSLRAFGASSPAGHDVVVTSGEDGVVYFVDMETETVLFESVLFDGPIPAIAIVPEQTHALVISGDDNMLYRYTLQAEAAATAALAMDSVLFRSPVAIRHVACSTEWIAIATEDPDVKVLRRSATDEVISVSGHTHGIKQCGFDPSGTKLCTSSEDSTVRVFALDGTERRATQVASFPVHYNDISQEDVLCRSAWSSAGDRLAVPTNEGVVEVYDTATWKSALQLLLPLGKTQRAAINIVSFSPNSAYLAAATVQKEVVVWQVSTKECLRTFRVDYNVLSLQWASKQNMLMVFNDGGRVGFVRDVIPAGRTPPQHQGKATESTGNNPMTYISQRPSQESGKRDAIASDDDDGETEVRVEDIKASFGFGSAAAHENDSANVDLGLANDEMLDDEDVSSTQAVSSSIPTSMSASRGKLLSPFQTHTEPFQSGSVHDGAVSLLAWTPTGEIERLRGATRGEQLIKVEFADKAKRGFKFTDNYRFSIAVLDEHGAFFAAPRRPRDDWDDVADRESGDVLPSVVHYRPFGGWASNSSWHLEMPDREDAECVAAAQNFCAVATSLHCLRLYTTSGVPLALLHLSGRIVTMAARDQQLAVVYNDICGRLEFQLLEIVVSPAATRVHKIAQGRVPMTPPTVDVFATPKENEQARQDVRQWSTLQWMGFDERSILYTVDSFGCVQALARSYDWNWFPLGCIGNGLQNKPEDRSGVFPLGIVHNVLLYLPLEGGQRVPKLRSGRHRPVPIKFAFQHAAFPTTPVPMTADETLEANGMWQQVRLAALEETSSTVSASPQALQEQAEMDKTLILMMKAACTQDEPARVLDLARCLHLDKSHQIARKLAVHYGFRELQTHLYELYQERTRQAAQKRYHSDETTRMRPARSIELHRDPNATTMRSVPRLARQPKPEAVQATAVDEEYNEDAHEESMPDAETSQIEATNDSSPSAEIFKPKPKVEKSVAPVNPFLKKPAAGSGQDSTNKKKGGLERLAQFTSPPPAKKARPTWK